MLVRKFALVALRAQNLMVRACMRDTTGSAFWSGLQDIADAALGGIHENPRV